MRPQFRHLALCILLVVAAPVRAQIAMPEGAALSQRAVSMNPANHVVAGDGAGGVWAVYQTAEPGGPLFVNHIDADGLPGQGFNGPRALTVRSTSVNTISAAADGLGGVVISWFSVSPTDSTSPYIALRYHHIDSGGVFMTPDTGLVVSTSASTALCTSDGNGGGYVVWEELKGTSNPDIVGQHYDYYGVPTWPLFNSPSGYDMCAVVGLQRLRGLVPDGAGGAYAIWADSRTSSTVPLYVAHLLTTGVQGSPWPSNGLRISPITSGVRIVSSAGSPANGLYIAWRDINVPNQLNGQHVLPNGSFAWLSSGPVLAAQSPVRAEFVSTTNSEVFVIWGGTDIRCERLATNGTRLWPETQGRVIAIPPGGASSVRAVPYGSGGQRLLWASDNAGQNDVAMMAVDADAIPLPGEPTFGTPVEADTLSEEPLLWVNGGLADPTIVWLDAGVIRARRLALSNPLGVPPLDRMGPVALATPYPNPVRGDRFTLRFRAPSGQTTLTLFDVTGRRVHELALQASGGEQSVTLAPGRPLAPGVYTVRLVAGAHQASRRIVRVD